MSNTEQKIEQEIQDKGLNAPRLTPDYIDSKITAVEYIHPRDVCKRDNGVEIFDAPKALQTLTFCILTLENGFTVTGESACASPENFDAEIGRKIAYNNAREKIWVLEGYLLKQKLHEQSLVSTPQQRIHIERNELADKIDKLKGFLNKGQPAFIDDNQWYLLDMQQKTMLQYLNLLDERIKLMGQGE